jgi:alginate O-acetyltransferase complex protein AlgI
LVFSSLTFLTVFLPLVLTFYFLLPVWLKNPFLLLCSLFFYAWGEVFFVFAMLASIAFNYGMGLWIARAGGALSSRLAVSLAVLGNLFFLGFYKYANFIVANLNDLSIDMGGTPIHLAEVHLPIGISFFTFQAMSYVIDVRRGEAPVQKNPLNLALYISLFPQLIAGPIVRYHDIARQLVDRRLDIDEIAEGIRRFIIGLAKKVLIANTLSGPADKIFGLGADQLTPAIAWLGVVCYTFQIYFDFSGYSDMAIGLGRMFGFRFLENFEYPYISQSIREFWRRWHISLSSWFRDYLYIPLGGNRGSKARTGLNLLLVFFLCGLWHGASWTFVIWGLYHGVFLVLERTRFGASLATAPRPVRHLYTLLVVIVGWVFFRSETFAQGTAYLAAMAGFAQGDGIVEHFGLHWNNEILLYLIVATIGSTPVLPWLHGKLGGMKWRQRGLPQLGLDLASRAALVFLLVLSAMSLALQTHNPFIYFRF